MIKNQGNQFHTVSAGTVGIYRTVLQSGTEYPYVSYWKKYQSYRRNPTVPAGKWIPSRNLKNFFLLFVNFDIFQGQDGEKLSKLRKPSRKKEKNERKMHNSFAK